MFRSTISILWLFVNISLVICGTVPSKVEPALLVISYDAFRPEYLNRKVTPNLNKFRKEGTSAPYMINVFPTKTFVNHFTIATGLYAENHGVLANEVYDSEQGLLNYGYPLFHYSNTTIPIWTANQKAGKHSGCMWPGGDFEYNGISCTFTAKFDPKKKWEDRVDLALSWFTDKKTPANLVMFYIEEPDSHAHMYGVDSPVITNMISKLDNLTQYIQDKLVATGLDKRVNVIHLSDHGMTGVAPPNFIYLDKILANDSFKMYGTSPILQIVPKDPSKEGEIYDKLTKAAEINGHFKVYTPKNIPLRWHANNTRRMGPILAVASHGYGFQDLMETAKIYEKKFNITITNETKYGVHGYDNQDPDMHAIFMAKGPLFAKGKMLKAVNMIDLYNLFCFILNIECGQNNGTKKLDAYDDLFAVKPVRSTQKDDNNGELVTWGVIFILLVVSVIVITKVRKLRQQHAYTRYLHRSALLDDFSSFDDELSFNTR
ncbi:ectonucleotide pyrophosphatase/phosphodiesterase family member 5-like [Contarinia nasturtii]|uniref:ectonucleotide pyrophosphatase/phosphodiesterase family member 5-like n=1 Tax=Contarinia nasturtii TaxID=265458 RepID=UPI0012D477FB|nr:ectonucleotide pyrophosphatase/phosphodiesterase family member 5-like [Contarinia nasturtii]XP_031625252.1 ectonucleotide pyrophosphatase/phosphodiesterase family member 5-like [Contarinia nasturtii]